MIHYLVFEAKDWYLGNEPTQSCRKTLSARLKGHGRRRETGNAEALMALD